MDERHPEGMQLRPRKQPAERDRRAVLCCAALSTGDDTAQLLQVDLKLNRSALQSLATPLLQAWEHRRKVSSPLGLIHVL